MAWRIDEQVVRGEIDNRSNGRVTGRIWFVGRDEPIKLDLTGNCWGDLAGHTLRFHHANPVPGNLDSLASRQTGVVGDITASRKVKVPDCSMDEMLECYKSKRPFPWHWANSLYLEWFSETNGRVVIESASYTLEISPEPAWDFDPQEEQAQRARNAEALTRFMDRLGAMHAGGGDDFDDDEPQSAAEAEADAEAAWMNLLLDRVTARLDREGFDESAYERIYEEERERLRRESGMPPEREPTPEEEAEHQAWIEEMNAAAEDALREMESEAWKEQPQPQRPVLLERAMDLGLRLRHSIENWLPDDAPGEHPLNEIAWGVQFASVKLGGALEHDQDEPWPPPAIFAGDTLVRLKKSRDCLRDALRAMDSADEENLASVVWRSEIRREIAELLGAVQGLIRDVRKVLKDKGQDEE